MNPIFLAVLLSLTPFGELRAGLPVAVVSGVPVWLALFVCVVANFLVVPVLFFFLEFVHHHFLHFDHYRSAFDRFMDKARKRSQNKIEKYGYFGLFLLVAVPLPFTGAYTGSLAAWFFGLDKLKSFIAIFLGILVAGLIVLSVSVGGVKFFSFI